MPCGLVCFLDVMIILGMGWGRVGIIPKVSLATLHDLHLHLMLHSVIFTCIFTNEDGDRVGGDNTKRVSCYAT